MMLCTHYILAARAKEGLGHLFMVSAGLIDLSCVA